MVRGAFGPHNDPSLEQEQSELSPPAVLQPADLDGKASSPPRPQVDNNDSNVHESAGAGNREGTAPGTATDKNGRRDGEGVGGELTAKLEEAHHADVDCNESVVAGDTKPACEKGVGDSATRVTAGAAVAAVAAVAAAAAADVIGEGQGDKASVEDAQLCSCLLYTSPSPRD